MEFNRLIPELSVKCIQKSLKFYRDILGFTIDYSRPEDKFYFLSYEGSQIMIEKINHNWDTAELEYPYGRGINFQIQVDNVEELVQVLNEHNYTLFRPLKESWYRVKGNLYSQKEFLVQDPDGYLLRFAEDLEGHSYE